MVGVICPRIVFPQKINKTMAIRILNNSTVRFSNSYVNLFNVAQYNLTLWMMEENAARNRKKQKRLTKHHNNHSVSHYNA